MDNNNIFGQTNANAGAQDAPATDAVNTEENAAATDVTASVGETAPVAGEPAPFASATPAPAPSPVVEPAPFVGQPAAVAGAAAPKKKGKGGLIAGIIAGVVVLGGGAGFAAYYSMHEAPERVVADGIKEISRLNKYTISIDLNAVPVIDDDYDESYPKPEKITLTANITDDGSKNVGGNGEFTITTDKGEKITVDADIRLIGEDAFYFKLDKLTDSINTIDKLKDGIVEESDDEYGVAAVIDIVMDGLMNALKKVDGEWFEIKLSEIDGAKKVISCYNEKKAAMQTDAFYKKVEDLYANNTFLSLDSNAKPKSKDGLKYYVVKYDSTKAEAFSDAYAELDEVKALSECGQDAESVIENYGDGYDFGTTKSDEEKKFSVDLTSSTALGGSIDMDSVESFKVGIKPWKHTIEKATAQLKSDDSIKSGSVDLTINRSPAAVTAPANAKSLDDLKQIVNELVEDLNSAVVEYQMSYLRDLCETYYPDQVQKCIDTYKDQVVDEDYSIFDMF